MTWIDKSDLMQARKCKQSCAEVCLRNDTGELHSTKFDTLKSFDRVLFRTMKLNELIELTASVFFVSFPRSLAVPYFSPICFYSSANGNRA